MKLNRKRILLVEDDVNFGNMLKEYLLINNYDITLAKNGIEGFQKFKNQKYDLCILDVMMPFKDGFTLAKEIREINDKTPLIFLTAKNLKEDVLKGFRIGADDYLTKPFDSEVLLAKLKALFGRRTSIEIPVSTNIHFKIGEFDFNSKLRLLSKGKENPLKLSPKESALLRLLIINVNDLLSREVALNKIWRDENYFTSRSMDVYIAKLRKYLRKDKNIEIVNIHGEGFRLVIKNI
tara:strand:- start:306 stop:1013 length:708 start_codon:yes stop_codon:yes gene_type:complete